MAGGGECIHSGHFMVSHFEAEAQDDEGLDAAAPAPPAAIDASLNNLFQCMSLAYRQKLTSPKWNRFKGVRLRWKDKIRLNNVIWRCWHMQFIMKQNTLACQFASPLDVDTHIKPEATILEGKYWKRRAEAVKAEYKKWRMYYRNKAFGCSIQDVSDVLSDMDVLDWHSQGDNSHMLVDEDYISFMSDTLFSTITNNQPFAFPDTREIARGANLADFIQPSLGPLQPNLEDFMDTLEPLHELISSAAKLPPVPEESVATDESVYRNTFAQPLMVANYPQIMNQPQQYPINQMSSSHLPHLTSQTPHQSITHTDMHQPHSSGLQSNRNLDNQQSAHNPSMISAHGQNQGYMQQQTNSNSQIEIKPSVITQNQTQTMMIQPYSIINSGIISHQNVPHSGSMLQQQNVLPNTQEVVQKNQYMTSPKMYHQITPAPNYHDRNYNISQGVHQNRIENTAYTSSSRRNSGSGGCIRERMSRQRPSPFVPPPPTNFNQFNPSPTTPNAPQSLIDKTSYGTRSHDHNIINTNIPQNISLTAGIYLSNINNQAEHSMGRFKMPSPPPQINNSAIISVPQVATNSNNSNQQLNKGENFRSNSLPLGASIGTMLGTNRVRRRPRSGSSSPAPPRRSPLTTTASEPSLNRASVILAKLLTTKSQEMYKPTSMQSLKSENTSSGQYQVHQFGILPAPAVSTPVTNLTPTSPQLSSYGSGSPTSAASPQSPPSPLDGNGGVGKEHKRAAHIHTEQKRRYNIKTGFDLLQTLIPQLSQNPNAKVSKAAMLQKGAEYIKQLQTEMNQIKEETNTLKLDIESLNASINNCQSLLPATGAPISRQRSGRLKEMFDEYVCQRTNENWKFWIFSLLVEPLLASFNNCVSPASPEELKRSTLLWAEQHCSLVEMRPAALNALKHLYSTTDILSDPNKLPEEALAAVNKKKSKDPKSSGK